ncbi:hypothetical protein EV363DRAFT_1541669 [Boletus edulis]|uniref:Uncharacterized protein n=1 Tax=Boletus edulis BED1 TaxID=1328754 RepID=A0AAD4BJT5_BOLED|nr:hypothetical protein EV363DRAFT_1541669 [Boletus edulis]KAF8416232.1 hypothetical protein L210DRAFT_3511875 [Boletus edulis BED1]KAF8432358.1 hypothetical protein L210DRAFT_3507539 [Boletus edulis BED1]KAF8433779.1 hypothetical protein L210DRAFT_3506975 [Boletus edulis BED1]
MSTMINIKTIPRPHGFTLNEHTFSLRFHGDISAQDIPEYIPVQIFVHVDDKWAGELFPVVHTAPGERLVENEPLTAGMFPFLPLPQDFQPSSPHEWLWLMKNIEGDLLADPHLSNTNPERYFLMRELFWMAFIAAFPAFPHGTNWPRWDPQISMEGDFISRWVLKDSTDFGYDGFPNAHAAIRQFVWEKFSATVEEILLIPVTY